MATGEFRFHALFAGAAALEKGIEFLWRVFIQRIEVRQELGCECRGSLERAGECIQPFVQPSRMKLGATPHSIGDVDVDIAGLADTIEAADTLL